jgi:hypothetical protein
MGAQMKYSEQLKLSASWLLSVRNADGGWGLNPKQASSIVNTAEALYVLDKAQKLPTDLNKSIKFLRESIDSHPITRGSFLRYYAFTIIGLRSANVSLGDKTIQVCAQTIREKKIPSKGWNNSPDNPSPTTFPTFLALWALQMIEQQPSQETHEGLRWLLSIQKKDGGWGYNDNPHENSNAASTAYALIILKKFYNHSPELEKGKSWLLSHAKEWLGKPIIGEPVGGTDWHHCNPAWSLYALLEYGEPVSSSVIMQIIQLFQTLFDSQIGSWRETQELVVNIRSTFWAVLALEQANNLLDIDDFASIYPRENRVIIGTQKINMFVSKPAFILLIVGFPSFLASLYVIIFYLVKVETLLITQITAKIVISIVYIFALIIMLSAGRKQIAKKTFVISTFIIVMIPVFFWLIKNPYILSTVGAISSVASLIFAFLVVVKEQK